MGEVSGKQPKRADPIRRALGLPTPARPGDTLKREPNGESAGGTPAAGRTTLQEVRRHPVTGFLQVLGPGLITGASDDDPSGIGTYSQVGSRFGYGLLWAALFTFPLMAAVQELCARIALQTGAGLGVSLRKKFPTTLVAACVLLLFVANTINVGADLGAIAAGGSLLTGLPQKLLVLAAGLLILGLQFFLAYPVIFRIFKWLTLALFAYVITAFVVHPNAGKVVFSTFVPHVEPSKDFITALVAVLGTTISPYLFFWQASSEVDEMRASGQVTQAQRRGVRKQELAAARFDILVGMFFSNIVMFFIILTSAAVLNAHGKTNIESAAQAAAALQPLTGRFSSIVFAAGMIGTGLLAIPILSGSAAYALKEVTGIPGTLASRPRFRPTFYIVLALSVVIGFALNFVHIDPMSALFWTAVINGLVAPPLMVLIVILGSDRKLMADKVSGKLSLTLTWLATALMSAAAVAMILTTWVIK